MGKNIDQLPELVTMLGDDLVYVRKASDPIATADKKILASNFFASNRVHGQLFMDILTAPATDNVTATPAAITDFDNASPLKGVTASLVNGTLVIDAGTPSAVYTASFSVSFTGTANVNHAVAIYINGSITGLAGVADLTNNSVSSATLSASGMATLNAGDSVDLRIWTASGTSSVDYDAIVLTISSI